MPNDRPLLADDLIAEDDATSMPSTDDILDFVKSSKPDQVIAISISELGETSVLSNVPDPAAFIGLLEMVKHMVIADNATEMTPNLN